MSSAPPWTRYSGTPSGRSAAGEASANRSGTAFTAPPRSVFAGTRPERSLGAALEIDHTRLRDRCDGDDPRRCAWSRRRKSMPGRDPEGEVAARRVAARRDSGRIDGVNRLEVIDRGGDVFERARPAAALLAHAPVLDVPRGNSPAREIDRQRGHQRAIPADPPEASVDEHHARPRPALTCGQVKIGDLIGVIAVRDRSGRRQRRL